MVEDEVDRSSGWWSALLFERAILLVFAAIHKKSLRSQSKTFSNAQIKYWFLGSVTTIRNEKDVCIFVLGVRLSDGPASGPPLRTPKDVAKIPLRKFLHP